MVKIWRLFHNLSRISNAPMMKLIYFCLFLALFSVTSPLFSQSAQIKQLESEIKNKSGPSIIPKAFKLSELYMKSSDYNSGIKWLDRATKEAKKTRVLSTISQVNTQCADLILNYAPQETNYLQKACDAIQESLKNNIDALEQDNLDLLYKIQSRSNDARLNKKVNDAINEINTKREEIAKELQRKELEQKKKDFKYEDFLSQKQETEKLKEEQEKLEGTVGTLTKQQRSLYEQNRDRQKEIADLSAEQAKIKLLLALEKNQNDSLKWNAFQDSIKSLEVQQELQEQKAEIEKSEAAVKHKDTQNKLIFAIASIVALISVFLFLLYRSSRVHYSDLEIKNKIIEAEKKKSDELLLNILPAKVADELKENGKVKTQYFESATVMFIDFKKFSEIAATVKPEILIQDLDYCFSKFDKIVVSHGIEKIKTIGDAYMCVGGVPNQSNDHATKVVKAAMEMQEFLVEWNATRKDKNFPIFEARIGIHSGHLIAGVVGTIKFVYDIWGNTVNIADRMQNSGEAGQINISNATKELLKGDFHFEHRGKLQLKNMDDMDGYFVTALGDNPKQT